MNLRTLYYLLFGYFFRDYALYELWHLDIDNEFTLIVWIVKRELFGYLEDLRRLYDTLNFSIFDDSSGLGR